MLKRIKNEIYISNAGEEIVITSENIKGLTEIEGIVSEIEECVSEIRDSVSEMERNVTELRGDVTEVWGDIDYIPIEERENDSSN